MSIMGGSWGLQERGHHPCLQERWSAELQASQPHLSPWEGDGENPPGNPLQTYEEQEVIGSSHNWFMKEKTYCVSLMAFYGEIWWPWGMKEEQQVSFILTLWETFDSIP